MRKARTQQADHMRSTFSFCSTALCESIGLVHESYVKMVQAADGPWPMWSNTKTHTTGVGIGCSFATWAVHVRLLMTRRSGQAGRGQAVNMCQHTRKGCRANRSRLPMQQCLFALAMPQWFALDHAMTWLHSVSCRQRTMIGRGSSRWTLACWHQMRRKPNSLQLR